jgi:1-aminocyclopropane-1-carboxylate deaminase/D-cysteine desulfhydrase-like pyridoxal-dependent ACC family enzyme
LQDTITNEAGVNLYIKRDDLIHPYVSGNKWRKLKYNIAQVQSENKSGILTFGGAFSNHIHATAAAGKIWGFHSIGIIRGEAHYATNPTLSFATEAGMQLHFWTRELYKRKDTPQVLKELQAQYPLHLIIPEGGSNTMALAGCKELLEEINIDFDYCAVACGTATTLAGMAMALKAHQNALGFAVLNAPGYISQQLEHFEVKNNAQIKILEDYHFGKYAAIDKRLVEFIDWFEATHPIKIDPVYTGKMLYGLYDLMKKKYFHKGSKIMAIHTGGIQGYNGMLEKINKLRNH